MSVLQKCVENGTRVKVTTRKLTGVRGTCTGVLIAFDKHWNLALVSILSCQQNLIKNTFRNHTKTSLIKTWYFRLFGQFC